MGHGARDPGGSGGPQPSGDRGQRFRGQPPFRGNPGSFGSSPPWRDRGADRQTGSAASPPPPNLIAADEELVAGRRPVEEAFVARRPAHRLLVVPQRRQALEKLVLHATSLRIPVVEVEGGTLTAIAGFDGHQGVALVVEPRTWATIDEILARAVERAEPPFVLVLDSLEDPQNVGTLLRSAEAAGAHGVVFPTHHQAPLTPAAVKASAGAVEHLLLAPVDDLPAAMSDLRVRGLRIAAAEADAPLTATDADLRGPLAIVVGSEGSGLSPAVRRRADLSVRIPMRGAIGSLNAAVAGSILLFAAVAQRGVGQAGAPDVGRPAPAPTSSRDDAIVAEPSAEGAPAGATMDATARTRSKAVPSPRKSKAVAPEKPEAPPATPKTAATRKPKAGTAPKEGTTAVAKRRTAAAPNAVAAGTPTSITGKARRPRGAAPTRAAEGSADRPAEDAPASSEAPSDAAEDLLPGGPTGS